ncbi:MAG TPA: tetratricopeptide repeat protein [Chthonomonadales bacterium]|nr:tetratricopeptide repeat protein [Chthonomonadales bacterium]
MSDISSAVDAVEAHWRVPVPGSFRRLYAAPDFQCLWACAFLSVEEIEADLERHSGMLPAFLPFGRGADDDLYGFYALGEPAGRDLPVLRWSAAGDHYHPVATGFDSFLLTAMVLGRHAFAESGDPGEERQELECQSAIAEATAITLPEALNRSPRNEAELLQQWLDVDPRAPEALLHAACRALQVGEIERSRDLLTRASETAPRFADPYYLLAQTYARHGQITAAMPRWWEVLQCPIALSTRTCRYDLGLDHPDLEIHEAATRELMPHLGATPAHIRTSRLASFLQHEGQYRSAVRIPLADDLLRDGDIEGAEREYLNALALATQRSEERLAYDRLVSLYDRLGRTREAGRCRADSELPT